MMVVLTGLATVVMTILLVIRTRAERRKYLLEVAKEREEAMQEWKQRWALQKTGPMF
jgi:heme exporter protein D